MKKIVLFPCLAITASLGHAQIAPTTNEPDFVENNQPVVLEEFTVTGQSEQGYIVNDAISGSRAGAKIVESPFSISTITNEFMNDFHLFELADQMQYVPGGFAGAEDTGANNGKKLRGFNPPVLRDGFSGANPPNRATVDRVEFIRGPVSALYGASSPGGLINYVSKRGKRVPEYSANAIFGSYGFRRYSVDATGPLVKDKLYYYGNFTHDYTESDLENFFNEKDLFAAGFTYVVNRDTLVTVSYEKQRMHSNQGDTIPLLQIPSPTRTVGIYWDLATFNVMGPDNRLLRDFESVNILIEHRFAKNLIGRLNLQSYDKDFDEMQYRFGSGVALQQNATLTGELFRQEQDISANLFQADLRYTFETGRIKHTLLSAIDGSLDNDYHNSTYVVPPESMRVNNTTVFRRPTFTINPFNPVWPQLDASKTTQLFQDQDRSIDNLGAFLGHNMSLMDGRLNTLVGARYDRVENSKLKTITATSVVSNNNQTPVVTTLDGSGSVEDALSYSIGASYKIKDDAFVVYANHSTGFEPTVSIDAGTFAVVPNEKSRGMEIGAKGLLLNETLSWVASAFDIVKDDVAISNPDYNSSALPGTPQFFLGGKERAKGYEFDLRWSVNRSLYFQIGGSFVDAEVTEPVASRDQQIKVPRYSAYFASRYVVRKGSLRGLKFGVSANYVDAYLFNAGSATRFRQVHPDVTLVNGFIGYSWRTNKKWKHSAQINGLNLGDKFYLQDTFRVARGREIRLSYRLAY